MTNLSNDDTQALADDLKKVIEEQKQGAITALLRNLFHCPTDSNSPRPKQSIGYVAVDTLDKYILIPKENPKEFFSIRRYTSVDKAIQIVEEAYPKYTSSIPYLATIPIEEFKALIRIRLKNQVITNDSNMLYAESMDKAALTRVADTIEWKTRNLNQSYVRYNNLRNTFISAMKSIQQSAEEAEGKIDANTLNLVVKEFLSKNLVEYTELDYVHINTL
jgi:hypothetical protein